MQQKTVRFYDDAAEDVSALEKLNNYRKYGFTSSRAMIIATINMYSQGDNVSLGFGSKEIEELAEHIVNRMKNMNVVVNSTDGIKEEKIYENETTSNNDDNYQKALSFMETL